MYVSRLMVHTRITECITWVFYQSLIAVCKLFKDHTTKSNRPFAHLKLDSKILYELCEQMSLFMQWLIKILYILFHNLYTFVILQQPVNYLFAIYKIVSMV